MSKELEELLIRGFIIILATIGWIIILGLITTL